MRLGEISRMVWFIAGGRVRKLISGKNGLGRPCYAAIPTAPDHPGGFTKHCIHIRSEAAASAGGLLCSKCRITLSITLVQLHQMRRKLLRKLARGLRIHLVGGFRQLRSDLGELVETKIGALAL